MEIRRSLFGWEHFSISISFLITICLICQSQQQEQHITSTSSSSNIRSSDPTIATSLPPQRDIYANIHNEMSLDEIRNLFHVDTHQLVPQYEVVHLQHKIPNDASQQAEQQQDNVDDVIEIEEDTSPLQHVITEKAPKLDHEIEIDDSETSPQQQLLVNYNNTSQNDISDDNLLRVEEEVVVVPLIKNGDSIINIKNVKKYPKKTLSTSDMYKKDKIKQQTRKKSIKPNYVKNSAWLPLNNEVRIVEENIQLEAFGQKLNLTLKPTDGLIKKGGLKIFTVQPNVTAQHGVDYIEVQQDENEEHIGMIYQDEENEAAILLRPDKETGKILVEGSIGKDLVIKPLPKHLRKIQHTDLSDDEMFLNQDDLNSEVSIDTGLPIRRRPKRESQETNSIKLSEHVIYKRKLNEDDFLSDYAFMEPDHLAKRYRRRKRHTDDESTNPHPIEMNSQKRTKREAPYVIYPEILVIVDYDGYRLHGGDNLQIKRYFVSFWNGVDLRYKLLKGPKVRISIAGIIISRGRDATPYLERNRVGRDAIDSAAALTDMGKYLFKERRLPVYDIAVAITKYDMCRRRKGGRCTKGTAGFAYVGGACVVNKRLEKVNSVAIIEDTGGFSGIIVAAHEVGHLLGAVHDGSPPPSYLGGPGAEKCRWEDGYIMSDLRHTERGFRWSPCSIQSFHHFLNGDTATCLYNSPHEDESLGRVLPGKLLTLDAQCRRDRGTSACFKDDRVCAQLFCFDSGSGYCVAYRPAAEGSACGDGQYCLNGRCVTEHENIIPDYSQNTPAYIRRQDLLSDDIGLNYQNTASTDIRSYSTTQRYTTPITEAPTPQQNPYNYYQQQQYTTESTENPYHNNYNQNYYTSENPYKNYYQPSSITTKNPYYYSSTTRLPTTRYSVLQYQSTTTKKPSPQYYMTKSSSIYGTTKNPYVGDYYERRTRTTKNPYDFAHFGRSQQQTTRAPSFSGDTNYLKRSSNYHAHIQTNKTRSASIVSG